MERDTSRQIREFQTHCSSFWKVLLSASLILERKDLVPYDYLLLGLKSRPNEEVYTPVICVMLENFMFDLLFSSQSNIVLPVLDVSDDLCLYKAVRVMKDEDKSRNSYHKYDHNREHDGAQRIKPPECQTQP